MPYIDDYKEYLRGKTLTEMGNDPLDVDHMTEDQLSTAMGYMLLKSQKPGKDRPFLPTQEEYDLVVKNLVDARREFEIGYDFAIGGDRAKKAGADGPKWAAYDAGKESIPSAKRDPDAYFNSVMGSSGINDRDSAVNYLLGMYQNEELGYAGKELAKEGGYLTFPGPKFTDKEKELLMEKARLHADPPEKPGRLKSALRSSGQNLGRSWFQKDFDAYDRLSEIDGELARAHADAEGYFAKERAAFARREAEQNREQPPEEADPTMEYLNGYLRSAEKLRDISATMPGGGRLAKLAKLGLASVKSIKHHLDPKHNPPLDEEDFKILGDKNFNDKDFGESLRCLAVFQMYANPVDSDNEGVRLKPLYEEMRYHRGIANVLLASKEICPVGSEKLSKDAFRTKIENNEPIFRKTEAEAVAESADGKDHVKALREKANQKEQEKAVEEKVSQKSSNNAMQK